MCACKNMPAGQNMSKGIINVKEREEKKRILVNTGWQDFIINLPKYTFADRVECQRIEWNRYIMKIVSFLGEGCE